MKRFYTFISILLFVIVLLPVNANAASAEKVSEIIYLDNGCYITIETTEFTERASTTKRGNRAYIYRDNSGSELWRATLYGTWTYTGTSATCTAVSCSTSITDTDWYEVSKTTSKSGATAYGTVTMGKKFLGITTNKETLNMSLTCDANGNLS